MNQIKPDPRLEDKIQLGVFDSEFKASLAGLVGFTAYFGVATEAGINIITKGDFLSGGILIVTSGVSAYFAYRSYKKVKEEYERLKSIEKEYVESKII